MKYATHIIELSKMNRFLAQVRQKNETFQEASREANIWVESNLRYKLMMLKRNPRMFAYFCFVYLFIVSVVL